MSRGINFYLCEEYSVQNESMLAFSHDILTLYLDIHAKFMFNEINDTVNIVSLSTFNTKNNCKSDRFLNIIKNYPMLADISNTAHYFNVNTYKFYKRMLSLEYGYVLHNIAEALNIKEHPNNNKFVLSGRDMADLSQALKYLIRRKYDESTEEILNNHYIKMLGEYYLPYSNGNKYVSSFDKELLYEFDTNAKNIINLLDVACTAIHENANLSKLAIIIERFD
jgi:hypothetical protein